MRAILDDALPAAALLAALSGAVLLAAETTPARAAAPGATPPAAPASTAAPGATPAPHPTEADHPPIPVRFRLAEPGYVTLVIDDAEGRRVRNLLSETPYPAGEHTAWWDGLDDAGRDPDAAAHAVYRVPGRLVTPGAYRVRGLVRPELGLLYEMTPYNEGRPPWPTASTASEWLGNHTPPSAVLFVPPGAAPDRAAGPAPGGQVLVGSYVSEGGSGLAWLDLEGHKLHGQLWIGGVWTGASVLARDEGPRALPGVYAYTGAWWKGDKYNQNRSELRLYQLLAPDRKGQAPRDRRFGYGEDAPVVEPNFALPDEPSWRGAGGRGGLGGLAVRDALLVASVPSADRLLFLDAAARRVVGHAPLADPRGLAFAPDGRLLALAGTRLVRFALPAGLREERDEAGSAAGKALVLPAPEAVVGEGLDDPQQVALDGQGRLYVTDRGASHQVKVFTPEGRLVRALGKAGRPAVGAYDPLRMHNPRGVTVSGDGRVWVAEEDYTPKRVSVWTPDGQLVQALYGPPQYGGGGDVDPRDPTLFYYGGDAGGMLLRLDYASGASRPLAVYCRTDHNPWQVPYRSHVNQPPQTALYVDGRRYLTGVYNSSPTGGAALAVLWLWKDDVAVPKAALGRAASWPLLATPPAPKAGEAPAADAFASGRPAGAKPADALLFAWTDRNDDAQVQPEEVTFQKARTGGVTVMRDLAVVVARVDDRAMRYPPVRFTAGGAPCYDLAAGEVLAEGVQAPTSSGGDQALVGPDGWTVLTVAPKPFAPQGPGGVRHGRPVWSYPSLWPGLHASHIAPKPDRPGQLIGTTRLLGLPVTARGSDAGPVWAVNGNKGTVYLFTLDGLFVATLFKDCRAASWAFPRAERGMSVAEASLHEENFWPTLAQSDDGRIYLVAHNGSIVRVEGLERVRRLPEQRLEVTAQELAAAQAFFLEAEARRQRAQADAKKGTATVRLRAAAPTVDGNLDDWAGADWILIDSRTGQVGDWGRVKMTTEAALAVAGDRLFLAFRTDDPNLLRNAGRSLPHLFKTGGALDLMIGADPKADAGRRTAAAGDARLVVTRVEGRTAAVLYRPMAPREGREPTLFSSPLRTIAFDRVDDVSRDVTLASAVTKNKEGNRDVGLFEVSVPLALLGLAPRPGLAVRGDVGVLRGNGFLTLDRVYWSNKATGLTSDEPSEAELTPHLWGRLEFAAEAPAGKP